MGAEEDREQRLRRLVFGGVTLGLLVMLAVFVLVGKLAA
jgi:hypothetical protein